MSDSDQNASAIENQSLQLGKWGNLLMAAAGIAAAYFSHSDALLIDGLYSGLNFVSAIVAAKIGASVVKPADRRYPFGYGAYEAIYVNYRALVLLGIMTFAAFGAIDKIIRYATGGAVPKLVFGPILVYAIVMVAICMGLALWHRYNWQRSGKCSELLLTESKAAIVDGVISAGAGGGLLAAGLLRGTSLEWIVPVADSIVVLIMSACIIRQPVGMFVGALREIAGAAVEPSLAAQVKSRVEAAVEGVGMDVKEVAVTKLGRTHFVIPYLQPESPVSADQLDQLRRQVISGCADLLGEVNAELILTAEEPFLT